MSRRGATMLVVTANWAIPDGTVSAPPPRGLFERLFADVRRVAVRAGFRCDGRYRPIDRVVLVLAGDTFDCLVSDRWLGSVRPWESRREAAARRADHFREAWKHARRPLLTAARLARRGIAVPAAGPHGRPATAAAVAVPVHVVMLAGDRDPAVERSADALPWRRLGIGVGNAWDGEAVRVVHGSAADPLAIRDTGPTLLESLAVDLLARFGAAVVAQPGSGDRRRRLVRSLATGHPLDMPLLLRNLLPLVTEDAVQAARVVDIWRRSVERWAREARRWGCAADDHGAVDAIAWWLELVEPDARPRPAAHRLIEALATPMPFRGERVLTVAGHIGLDTGGSASQVICLGPAKIRPDQAGACHRPGPAGVSCIQTGRTMAATGLPAVAVFEAGEGAGRTSEWLTARAAVGTGHVPSGATPILDAA